MSVNNDDHQEQLEALETLSLEDFTLIEDDSCGFKDHHHRNIPSSPATEDLEDLFEFRFPEEHRMSHAEDMFSDGKLIPINDLDVTRNEKHIHRRRSESMHELKSHTNKATASKLVRTSYSLDYKKLNRNSRLNYETPSVDNHRNNLSNKTSSSRWADLVFGPLKVPHEMDLRDIRNRQIVNTSKANASDRFAVSGVRYNHRKPSWGVLGILSCKSSGSVAVSMPLSYEKLSLKN